MLGSPPVSLSTVGRDLKKFDLQSEPEIERKRFVFEFANDCWQTDILSGPYLTIDGKKRRVYEVPHNPFTKGLPAQYVFESADYKQFSSRMEYFKSTKGFACGYGEPGSGKTTSLRAFISKLNPQLFQVVYLPLSTTTVQEFYRHLAVGLGLLPKFRKVDLFHQIQEQIVKSAVQKNLTTFIIIGEAQFIGHAVLHDLRLLFNFQMDSKDYACVLLIGQPLFLNHLSLQIH